MIVDNDPWLDRINSIERTKTGTEYVDSLEESSTNVYANVDENVDENSEGPTYVDGKVFGRRKRRRMRRKNRNGLFRRRIGDAAFRLVDNNNIEDDEENEIMSKIVNRDAIVDERQTEFYGSSPGKTYCKEICVKNVTTCVTYFGFVFLHNIFSKKSVCLKFHLPCEE